MAYPGEWGEKSAVAEHGMVTSQHPLASEAGVEMLQAGGNAIDAAVATALAIGVVQPFLNGLGGGGYMVLYLAQEGRTAAIDYAMQGPLAAQPDMYQIIPGEFAGNWPKVVDDANLVGYRSIAVPGTAKGLALALERYGTMKLAEVIQPAIRYAREGFPLHRRHTVQMVQDREIFLRYPATAAIFLKDEQPYEPGDILVQPDLTRTLEAFSREGPDLIYRGEIAHIIAEDMAANGGMLTLEDLARYRVRVYEPGLVGSYRGHSLVTAPGACAGLTVLEILNMLESFDLRDMPPAEYLHHFAEANRMAAADRFLYLGDPERIFVPWEGLVSKAYAAERAKEISAERTNPHPQAGDPWRFQQRPATPTPWPRPSYISPDGGTIHLTVIDKARNMVSLTQTLLGYSRVVIPGTGMMMNNGMGWFDPMPGSANSIGPGKRGLNNMAPTLAFKDGQPLLALGASGGRKIWPAVALILAQLIDRGMGLKEAIEMPRLSSMGSEVEIDTRIGAEVREELAARGQKLVLKEESFPSSNFSEPNGILIDAESGMLHGSVYPWFKPSRAMGY